MTYFYCHSCHEVPDSLRIQTSQIFIFKLTPKNEIVAYPIISKINNENNVQEYCTSCNYSSKDVEMNVCKQVFVKCPSCLIVSL
jgi:predicted enzyme involved in methoxymalonyl-ACP biosynthesis